MNSRCGRPVCLPRRMSAERSVARSTIVGTITRHPASASRRAVCAAAAAGGKIRPASRESGRRRGSPRRGLDGLVASRRKQQPFAMHAAEHGPAKAPRGTRSRGLAALLPDVETTSGAPPLRWSTTPRILASRARFGASDSVYFSGEEKSRVVVLFAPSDRGRRFAEQKAVDAVDHLAGDVALERERRGARQRLRRVRCQGMQAAARKLKQTSEASRRTAEILEAGNQGRDADSLAPPAGPVNAWCKCPQG